MPPEPAARLDTLAHDLLDAIEDAADAHSIVLPDRRFVAVGAVAWDCPLVCVALPTIARGRPLAAAGAVNRESDTFVASFELWLLRDVPGPDDDGNPPSVDAIVASAAQLNRDGYVLTVGLTRALRTIEGTCSAVAQTTTQAVGPDGGLGGWQSTVEVKL